MPIWAWHADRVRLETSVREAEELIMPNDALKIGVSGLLVGFVGWVIAIAIQSGPGPVIETLVGGLLVGVLYSLIALGVVLIFKASGIFNFAQGSMVLFAALSVARLGEIMPLWIAIVLSMAIMVMLAYAIELLVLRRLVNQEQIILFMATIGITYFLDGFGQTIWGSDIYKIDLGLPKRPIFILEGVFPGGLLIDPADVIAAIVCALLVVALALFFQFTRVGRALRAVADDHQAAQSVGIPLNRIWLLVWAVGGLVALVAGVIWGNKLGVQFSLSLIALKALPVLILGGFTSIPGAIIGGLIIGAGEKLAEVVIGPHLVQALDLAGGGIENWFAYVLALLFLLIKPQGLFGEQIIERV
jgi:branched-chain amino acid transport system permease protein